MDAAGFLQFTGAIVDYTTPRTGTYDITTAGAQGGNAGGLGYSVTGAFSLNAGNLLEIAVGGQAASP